MQELRQAVMQFEFQLYSLLKPGTFGTSVSHSGDSRG